MLIVKETKRTVIGFNPANAEIETEVRCENCYQPVTVWSYMPRACPACDKSLPNVIRLRLYSEDKIKYHFRFMEKD